MPQLIQPPKPWTIVNGTWETDADYNATGKSGEAALRLVGAGAPELWSDYCIAEEQWDYKVFCTMMTSAVAAPNDIKVIVKEYTSAKGLNGTTTFTFNINSAGFWFRNVGELRTAAGTRWLRFILTKAAVAFTATFDNIDFDDVLPTWRQERASSVLSIPDATWTTITTDTDVWKRSFRTIAPGSITLDTISDIRTLFTGSLEVAQLTNGRYAQLRVVDGGIPIAVGPKIYANGTEDVEVPITALVARDSFALQLFHNNGSARNVNNGSSLSWWAGTEMR